MSSWSPSMVHLSLLKSIANEENIMDSENAENFKVSKWCNQISS